MDVFLNQSNYIILYQWVKNQAKDVKETVDPWTHTLHKQFEKYDMCVSFYKTGIIEEIITNNDNNEIIYYIHFQFRDFHQGHKMFNDFFTFIKKLITQPKKVLICCSCGLTSTFFAENLQGYAKNDNISFQACSIDKAQNNSSQCDLILLTPQVHYYEPQLYQSTHKDIMNISIADYASHNYAQILSSINQKLS